MEGFGELLSLATSLLDRYPELGFADLDFHLVEAQGRILPEVSDDPGAWVVSTLEERGAHIHLNSQLVSAEDGHVVLSSGEEFDSEIIVWTAGNAANPVVAHHTDLPVDPRGLLVVRPDLRVGAEGDSGAGRLGGRGQRRGARPDLAHPGRANDSQRASTRSGKASGWRRIWLRPCAVARRGTMSTPISVSSPPSASGAASSSPDPS